MSDNVIQFKKNKIPSSTELLVSLDVFIDGDGHYEVSAEINDDYDYETIWDGLLQAAFKFGIDMDLVPEEEPTD